MDKKTQEFLHQCSLFHYVDVFKENEIDWDVLPSLNDHHLTVLFGQKLGPKIRFQNHIAKYLNKDTDSYKEETGSMMDSTPCTKISFPENCHDTIKIEKQEVTMNQNHGVHDCDEKMIVHSSTTSELSTFLHVTATANKNIQESVQIDLSSVNSRGLDFLNENDQNTDSNLRMKPTSINVKYKQQSNTEENVVEHYLNQNCIGQAILCSKKKMSTLNPLLRGKLCHEVIVGELGCNGDTLKINCRRFEELAEAIVKLFPKECKSNYFVPRKRAVGSMRPVQPKGLLYDKYHNLLKFLRTAGLRRNTRSSQKQNHEEDDFSLQEHIQWLQNNSMECQITAKLKWAITFKWRMMKLRNSVDATTTPIIRQHHIKNYMQQFVCLLQPWGLNLLVQDFEALYSNKSFSMTESWPTIYLRLLTLAKKTSLQIQEGNIFECLKLIPSLFKQPVITSLLSTKQNRRVWKPNSYDSSQGFLLHVKEFSLLQHEIQRLEDKCKSVDRTFLLVPVVVGNTEKTIEKSFVLVNNLLYEMTNVLEAFDYCFKIFHALHCEYPCQSSYSWLFVQKAIFQIATEWDPSSPQVENMLKNYHSVVF